MTFTEARRYLKKFIKSRSECIEGECYELPTLDIEKQINMAQEKGPGKHTFYYLKTDKIEKDQNGNPKQYSISLHSEKLNISD